MDITKEYILMCNEAMVDLEEEYSELTLNVITEIPRTPSGFYIAESRGRLVFVTTGVILYTQDQLQILSGLSWQEFDRECLKYNMPTKEQAGLRVVLKRLDKTTQ